MNDCVNKGRRELREGEIRKSYAGSLFDEAPIGELIPQKLSSDMSELVLIVKTEIERHVDEQSKYTGNRSKVRMDRQTIRSRIIPHHFAEYSKREYDESVGKLLQTGILASETGKTRISDEAVFTLVP